jgi:hypothetical protein
MADEIENAVGAKSTTGNENVETSQKTTERIRDYIFNFLMIFLAVFMGFLAENYRENLADKGKEKEYIKSLILNLQDDSLRLSKLIPLLVYKHKGLDSVVTLSKANLEIAVNRRALILNLFKYFKIDWEFRTNDATISQLKSSGDLRLLQKNHVADSIAKFDVTFEELISAEVYLTERHNTAVSLLWKITDITFVNSEDLSLPEDTDPPPIVCDNQTRIEFSNWLWNYSDATSHWTNVLRRQQIETNRLIVFLKKQYDMKK